MTCVDMQKENDKIQVEINVKSCDILRISDTLKCISANIEQSAGKMSINAKELVDLNRDYQAEFTAAVDERQREYGLQKKRFHTELELNSLKV